MHGQSLGWIHWVCVFFLGLQMSCGSKEDSAARVSDASDCGASVCGACPEGCSSADECLDGEWLCGCDCPEDTGSQSDTGDSDTDDPEDTGMECVDVECALSGGAWVENADGSFDFSVQGNAGVDFVGLVLNSHAPQGWGGGYLSEEHSLSAGSNYLWELSLDAFSTMLDHSEINSQADLAYQAYDSDGAVCDCLVFRVGFGETTCEELALWYPDTSEFN